MSTAREHWRSCLAQVYERNDISDVSAALVAALSTSPSVNHVHDVCAKSNPHNRATTSTLSSSVAAHPASDLPVTENGSRAYCIHAAGHVYITSMYGAGTVESWTRTLLLGNPEQQPQQQKSSATEMPRRRRYSGPEKAPAIKTSDAVSSGVSPITVPRHLSIPLLQQRRWIRTILTLMSELPKFARGADDGSEDVTLYFIHHGHVPTSPDRHGHVKSKSSITGAAVSNNTNTVTSCVSLAVTPVILPVYTAPSMESNESRSAGAGGGAAMKEQSRRNDSTHGRRGHSIRSSSSSSSSSSCSSSSASTASNGAGQDDEIDGGVSAAATALLKSHDQIMYASERCFVEQLYLVVQELLQREESPQNLVLLSSKVKGLHKHSHKNHGSTNGAKSSSNVNGNSVTCSSLRLRVPMYCASVIIADNATTRLRRSIDPFTSPFLQRQLLVGTAASGATPPLQQCNLSLAQTANVVLSAQQLLGISTRALQILCHIADQVGGDDASLGNDGKEVVSGRRSGPTSPLLPTQQQLQTRTNGLNGDGGSSSHYRRSCLHALADELWLCLHPSSFSPPSSQPHGESGSTRANWGSMVLPRPAVLVHCIYGVSRSPGVFMLFVMNTFAEELRSRWGLSTRRQERVAALRGLKTGTHGSELVSPLMSSVSDDLWLASSFIDFVTVLRSARSCVMPNVVFAAELRRLWFALMRTG